MKGFTITREMIENAVSYMPISTKAAVSKEIAKRAVGSLKVSEQNKKANAFLALPELCGEIPKIKAILLLNAFVGFYLDIDVVETYKKAVQDENGTEPDSEDMYDYFASSHLFNQMERFKSDMELKDKIFDILADYKDFKKFCEMEIHNEMKNRNDGLGRFTASCALFSEPETIKKLSQELAKTANEFDIKRKTILEKQKKKG